MDTVKEAYNNKLKNRLFTCLCERENDGSWEACLDAIIIEFMGIPEEERGINYYVIFYKLNTCKYLSFKYFIYVYFIERYYNNVLFFSY